MKKNSKHKALCIIAARAGSKRVKNKNIINFFGKPIISYPIKTALRSKLFSDVHVSTESKKISKIAIKYGANVPFLRRKKLARDNIGLRKVILEHIKKLKNKDHNFICYIYATAANIKVKDLIIAFKKIKKTKSDLIIGVKEVETNPLKYFVLKKNRLSYVNKLYNDLNSNKQGNFFPMQELFLYSKIKS